MTEERESKWQKAVKEHRHFYRKKFSTGLATVCPFCKGGTGMTENRKKKEMAKKRKAVASGTTYKIPGPLWAVCFTCFSIYERRMKTKITEEDGFQITRIRVYDKDDKVVKRIKTRRKLKK